MADELTPDVRHSDDRIRELEAKLDQKLEALNLAAREHDARKGEPAPTARRADEGLRGGDGRDDDVAVLRPTGASAGQDATPRPVEPAGGTTPGVSNLVAGWDDEDDELDRSPRRDASHEGGRGRAGDERPEPVHASWTRPRDEERDERPAASEPPSVPSPRGQAVEAVPSEEELQFWAHTRTALRNLQQSTEHLPRQVGGTIADEVERIVRDELGAPSSTLRLVQQHLQQGLPRLAERIEESLREELAGPAQAIRQVQDDLPARVDRLGREIGETVREDLERVGDVLQGGVQRDVAAVEQAVATNVTRMATSLEELVTRSEDSLGKGIQQVGSELGSRVERLDGDVGDLGRSVGRSERNLAAAIEQVEERLRAALAEIDSGVRAEVSESTQAVGRIESELPRRLESVERRIGDEVRSTRGDLSHALSGLADAGQASLDRLAGIAAGLDEDRTSRAEDVELVIDTLTTGWEGMAGAVQSLHRQNAEALDRLEQLEQRVSRLGELEQSMTSGIASLNRHILELKPAPVVVSVHHPDAEVSSQTRGGWLVEPGDDEG